MQRRREKNTMSDPQFSPEIARSGIIKADALPFEEDNIADVSAVSGWSLAAVSELDRYCPGFAGHFLRASDERRQVIAAYLAVTQHRKADMGNVACYTNREGEVAAFLSSASHSDILKEAFDNVPDGLRGALSRAGAQPHKRGFYFLLTHLLRGHRRPDLARAIQCMRKVDLRNLEIACVLPRELLHPDMVGRIHDRTEARHIAMAVGLLRARVIDRQAFSTGLRSLRRRGDMQDFFAKWVLKCEFARSPIPATDIYRPIEDGPTLARVALEYRNCSRTYAADLLEGEVSLAEYVTEQGSAIIHLLKRDGVWLLDDVHARRNRDVDPRLRSDAVEYLRLRGILERRVSAGKLTPHAALRRFLPRGAWL